MNVSHCHQVWKGKIIQGPRLLLFHISFFRLPKCNAVGDAMKGPHVAHGNKKYFMWRIFEQNIPHEDAPCMEYLPTYIWGWSVVLSVLHTLYFVCLCIFNLTWYDPNPATVTVTCFKVEVTNSLVASC